MKKREITEEEIGKAIKEVVATLMKEKRYQVEYTEDIGDLEERMGIIKGSIRKAAIIRCGGKVKVFDEEVLKAYRRAIGMDVK